MAKYKIKAGSLSRIEGKTRKIYQKGDEVEMTEEQAKRFGLSNLSECAPAPAPAPEKGDEVPAKEPAKAPEKGDGAAKSSAAK